MSVLQRIAASAAGCSLALLPTGTAIAQPPPATGNGAWSVGPANRSGSPAARPHFAMDAPPGATVNDLVRIANLTTKPITFRVYGADAYNTPRDAGFALRTEAEPRQGVGAWVRMKSQSMTIPARTARDVPFTVTVPPNATPGEHIGGIVALNTAIESMQQSGDARIGVRRAVGARIYLRVAGPVTPGLRPDALIIARSEPLVPFVKKGHGSLRYTVVNTGNLRLTPVARVWATGAFGRKIKRWPDRRLPEILPGQRTEITLAWDGLPPLDAVTIRVELTAAGGVKARTQSQFYALPWAALLTVLGVVFILWSLLPRLIRRWRERAGLVADDPGVL